MTQAPVTTAEVTEPVTEPPHEHLFSAWSVTAAPSCLSEGKEERARCNDLVYSVVREYMSIVEGETSVYHITLGIHDDIVDDAKYAFKAAPLCRKLLPITAEPIRLSLINK